MVLAVLRFVLFDSFVSRGLGDNPAVLPDDRLVDFTPVHRDFPGSAYSQLNLLTPNVHDYHLDAVADHYALIALPC
jgi:hypothetical protein